MTDDEATEAAWFISDYERRNRPWDRVEVTVEFWLLSALLNAHATMLIAGGEALSLSACVATLGMWAHVIMLMNKDTEMAKARTERMEDLLRRIGD